MAAAAAIRCPTPRRSPLRCAPPAWTAVGPWSSTTMPARRSPPARGGCCATTAIATSRCSMAACPPGPPRATRCRPGRWRRKRDVRRPRRAPVTSRVGPVTWRHSTPTAPPRSPPRPTACCSTPASPSATAATASPSTRAPATSRARATAAPATTSGRTAACSAARSCRPRSRGLAPLPAPASAPIAARASPPPTRCSRWSSWGSRPRCIRGPGVSGSPIRRARPGGHNVQLNRRSSPKRLVVVGTGRG
jgi:hypothetical protein